MKDMLQPSAVACKVFNIFTLTEQNMLRSSSSQSKTRGSRDGGTWGTASEVDDWLILILGPY